MNMIGIREIVFVLLLAVIPVGAWWLHLRPTSEAEASMMTQIQSDQQKYQQLNKAAAIVNNVQQEIASLEQGMAFLQAKLPSEKEIDKVVTDVWRLAEANELTPKSIRAPTRATKVADPNLPMAEAPVQMQIEGDFRGFYAFLQALENQPRIMRVHRISLKKLDSKYPEGFMRADIQMSIYFEKAKGT